LLLGSEMLDEAASAAEDQPQRFRPERLEQFLTAEIREAAPLRLLRGHIEKGLEPLEFAFQTNVRFGAQHQATGTATMGGLC
jgi:hypothetical protein